MAAPSRTAWTPLNFNATSGTINAPGGVAIPDGSLVLLTVSSDTASTVPVQTPGTGVPSGGATFCELIDNAVADNGGSASTVYSAWAWIASSEPTSYTVGLSVNRFSWLEIVYFTPDSGSWSTVQDALDNALSGGALPGTDYTVSTTSTEPSLPDLTTLGTDRRVYYGVTWDEGKSFSSAPAGTSNVYATATSTNAQRADDKTQASAGSTGTADYNISSGTRWIGMTLMVKNPSGGSSTTVSPGAGSLSVAGFAPILSVPSQVSPGVGALALTGYAPTITKPSAVTPGTGALSLTGFAPSITTAVTIPPGAGALSLTGYAPTISASWAVGPGAGSLSLTGYAPTISYSTPISPGAGSLTLTGYAPVITYDTTVIPGAGALALTGYPPEIELPPVNTDVPVGAGSLAITGFAPSFGYQLSFDLIPTIQNLDQLQKQLNAILERLQLSRAFYGPIFPTDPQDGQIFTLTPDQHIYQWQADHWEQLTS